MQYSVIEVSPNIRLVTDEAFGDFNVYIVKEILCYVDMTFSDALQIPCSSIDKCTLDTTTLRIIQCAATLVMIGLFTFTQEVIFGANGFTNLLMSIAITLSMGL